MTDRSVIFTRGATIPPFIGGTPYVTSGAFVPGAPPGVAEVGTPAPAERAQPPSTYAVQATLEGQNGAMLRLLGLTALRAVFIAPGLWGGAKLAGVPISGSQVVITSLLSSTTISIGMLGWYALNGALKKRGIGG